MSQINLAPATDILNTVSNAERLLVEAAKQLVATKSLIMSEPITQRGESKQRLQRIHEAEAAIDTAKAIMARLQNELLNSEADEPLGEGQCEVCGAEGELFAAWGSDYRELCWRCRDGGAL